MIEQIVLLYIEILRKGCSFELLLIHQSDQPLSEIEKVSARTFKDFIEGVADKSRKIVLKYCYYTA